MVQRKRPPNWEKIKAAYEAGEGSHRQLADRFKVPYPTLRDRANKESWSVDRSKTRSKVVAKTSEAIVEKKVKENLSDLQVVNTAIGVMLNGVLSSDIKSAEGASNALTNLIKLKHAIAPSTVNGIIDNAIAVGIQPEELISALTALCQQQASASDS